MSPEVRLIDSTLSAFAEQLAARTPTPGGGSQAAYLAASGAALVSMAFRYTSGEKFAAVESAMVERAKQLDLVRIRALELVDLDSRAYDGVTAAFALPKTNDSQKSERAASVQAALKHALEVPFETMQIALSALRLAGVGAPEINKNLASDCAVGAKCLAVAVDGAFLNVKINALAIKDNEYASKKLAAAQAMRVEARELAANVDTDVERLLT